MSGLFGWGLNVCVVLTQFLLAQPEMDPIIDPSPLFVLPDELLIFCFLSVAWCIDYLGSVYTSLECFCVLCVLCLCSGRKDPVFSRFISSLEI